MKNERMKKRGLNPNAENRLRDAVVGNRPTPFGYLEYLAERDEIMRHKWLESEKVGHDIGSDRAMKSWVQCHRSGWLKHRIRLFRSGNPHLADQSN